MRSLAICAVLAAILLLSARPAQAQVLQGWGLKVGVSSATQNWRGINFFGVIDPSWENHESFTAGLFVEGLRKNRFSVVVGASYIQYGFEANRAFPGLHQGRKLHDQAQFEHLSVSLQSKLRLRHGPHARLIPYVAAGPVLSFLLRGKGTGIFYYSKDSFSFFDEKNVAGLQVGAGTEVIQAGAGALLLEVGYTVGLTNTLRRGEAEDRVLTLTIGVRY